MNKENVFMAVGILLIALILTNLLAVSYMSYAENKFFENYVKYVEDRDTKIMEEISNHAKTNKELLSSILKALEKK